MASFGTFELDLNMEDDPGLVAAQAEIQNGDEEDDPGEYAGTPDDHYVDAFDQVVSEVEIEVTPESVNPPSMPYVSAEDFQLHKVLGRGGYGVVYFTEKVTGPDAGQYFATKMLSKGKIVRSMKDTAHTKAERSVLEIVNNPFIVDLKYAFQTPFHLYLVLEFCQGGELFSKLEKEHNFPEDLACVYAAEIAMALGHLHSMDVVYRDLKPENILLTATGHIKLTDFGLCKEAINGSTKTHTFCGTVDYMAPEIIHRRGHDKSVDWWSLGALLFDFITGGPPFMANNRAATIEKIKSGKVLYPGYVTNEAKSLIRSLIRRDPARRLGSGPEDVNAITRHLFFRHIDWAKLVRLEIPLPDSNMPVFTGPDDLQMFDKKFTSMPLDQAHKGDVDGEYHFDQFSYVNKSYFTEQSAARSARSPRKTQCSTSMEGYSPAKQAFIGTGVPVAMPSSNITLGFHVPGAAPPATTASASTGAAAACAAAAAPTSPSRFLPAGCRPMSNPCAHASSDVALSNGFAASGTAASNGYADFALPSQSVTGLQSSAPVAIQHN